MPGPEFRAPVGEAWGARVCFVRPAAASGDQGGGAEGGGRNPAGHRAERGSRRGRGLRGGSHACRAARLREAQGSTHVGALSEPSSRPAT